MRIDQPRRDANSSDENTSTVQGSLLNALLLSCIVLFPMSTLVAQPSKARTVEGLEVLYDFAAQSGDVVEDRSGSNSPIDLKIDRVSNVTRETGRLTIDKPVSIRTSRPPVRLIDAVRRSGAISIEAWIQPANIKQDGPARIVSLSKSTNERNWTLGQEKDTFDVRLRTTSVSKNGIPSLASSSRSVTTKLVHLVYTRGADGVARLWMDGKEQAKKTIKGAMNNHDMSATLLLGNEATGDRPWLGTYHLVAIYSQVLSSDQVRAHFQLGPQATIDPEAVAKLAKMRKQEHFRLKIAPLLAGSCLECHDSINRKGGLNLALRSHALDGGDSGPSIVPGKPEQSPLWQRIESDEMPENRPPLNNQEKQLLKEWIASGAEWEPSAIDPANYVHGVTQKENWIRRLTLPEYIQTVRATVGVDITDSARRLLPPDVRADGFSNTAYNLTVDLKHIEAYSQLAGLIVQRVDPAAIRKRFTKRNDTSDRTLGELVQNMGFLLLRGPLDDQERSALTGVAEAVIDQGGTLDEATSYLLEAMLQAPRFLYRIEAQFGSGSTNVSDYELASRLSYMLQGGPPDEELLSVAKRNALTDPEVLQKQISRLLATSEADRHAERFVKDWLNLSRLASLNPDVKRFPDWNAKLAADMQAETIAFFRHVVIEKQQPLSALIDAQVAFMTPELAKHYGLSPRGDGMQMYDVSGIDARGGLLTQGSLLTIGGDDASTVTRGLFVLNDLLRGVVPDPPPCVDTTPVETRDGLTQRQIAEDRIRNVSCGGCHKRFESLAFGLSKFDGLGRWSNRDEHGNRLRDDGVVRFPGTTEAVPFQDSKSLMTLLAKNDRVRLSLTWKVTQFAIGRPLVAEDAPLVESIHQTAMKAGGTWEATLTAIARSDLVLKTRIVSDEKR